MISIAIDGPSGAGKSTMAKKIAAEVGFVYVDTGAMYRAVGLYVLEQGLNSTDREGIIPLLPQILVTMQYVNGEQRIMLNGLDVSGKIRTETVAKYASDASAIPEVRAHLLSLQRDMEKTTNLIMDGRDIGTVVLPNASLKIFLIASLEERARRRYEELIEKGHHTTYEEVKAQIAQRDFNDSNRAVAPLKAADDAVLLDTTGQTVEETYATMLALIKERIHAVL